MFLEIEDIVETLKNAKERGTKCSVLIGAGCSVTADIPTAQGFVDVIKKKYPRKYERANPKTYPGCMSELSISEQRALIAEYVDKSKINWGHIALAQLIKEGYVDRILTTNFDPLVVRACALLGIFPAVYDFASSQNFEADKVPGQAIFYLHGQRTGFVLMNEEDVLKKQSELLAPVFEDAGRGRVWLVVGYSGENDPVFNHLAEVKRFDNNLYWVGYLNNEPAKHVLENLLSEEKDAFYIKGFHSDGFFVTLAQMLGCFPPEFVSKPFSYLDSLFNNLTSYTFPKTDAPVNAMRYARNFVREAIEKIEVVQSDVLQAWSDLLGGQHEKVIALQSKYSEEMHAEVRDAVAWAYIAQGNNLSAEASSKTGEEADALFKEAGEKYAEALKIKPDMHEAFYNWGSDLGTWARTKTGEEADALFKEAGEKYAEALKIKPDNVDVFYNWGSDLGTWAQTKTGEEADALFKEAGEKYAEAVKIKPDMHEAFYNWGSDLDTWARTKTGEEADALFKVAGEKFAQALKLKPDDVDVLYNWGSDLGTWAQTKTGEEADALFKEAGEKFAQALKLKPDSHESFYNWGLALAAWAQIKKREEADVLFKEAREKFAQALKLKPDKHEVLDNWGSMLLSGYRVGMNKQLLIQAKDILLQAEAIKDGSASYNLACASSLLEEEEECLKWLQKSLEKGDLPNREHLERDKDLDLVRDKQWFKDFLKDLP